MAPFIGAPFNAPGTQRTRGFEWIWRGAAMDGMAEYQVMHTFLDRSIRGQPKHVARGNVQIHPTDESLIGIGASYVGSRDFGGAELDGYFLARLYGEYRVTENIAFHARIENLLDEDYEFFRFSGDAPRPGAGLGAFGGVTVQW